MNQRSTFSRSKEPRREKIIRTKRDEYERFQDETPSRRSSSERQNAAHATSYSRFKDNYVEKPRSNSRDTPGSLVFRRQERGKLQTNFSKNSSREVSPGRLSHTDSMRSESSGRSNYVTHYTRSVSIRDRYSDNHIVDESRLKGILHRLLRDEDKERQASLIRQLRAIFEHPENFKMILSNRDDIFSTFEDFIQLGLNTELKHEFVLTVGSLGAILGIKARRLLEWGFSVIGWSKSEDLRILILKSILEMLKIDAEKKNLSELVPMMMSKLQSALENADMPDLLIAIVNAVIEISDKYPELFSKHFCDIVDILIGWHIDATQQQSVIEFTSNTLIGLRKFWISDINFTITLLGQFLEDMDSYAKGLPKVKPQPKKSVMYLKQLALAKLDATESTANECTPEENMKKIKSLIRVLVTVLRSIDLLTIEENGPITPSFMTQMLKNFLKYVKTTVEYCYCSDLMTSANECIALFLKFIQLHAKDALDQLMVYIEMLQSQDHTFMHESHLISSLWVMICFVKSVGTYLPVKFVTEMFSPTSRTRKLRFSPSRKIQKLLIELNHAVLAAKSVQIVEEFYKCIMVDITEAHRELLKSCSETLRSAVDQEIYKITLLSSICALVDIGNAKHSLIRMFAFKPSFFDLMINHLKLTEPEFSKFFPDLQASILYTLYSHCQRHSHFVNNSLLVNPKSSTSSPAPTSGRCSPIMPLSVSDIIGEHRQLCPPPCPTGGNLEKIIQLLIELIDGQHNSYDSKFLAVMWTSEILEQVQRHLPRLLQTSLFNKLLQATLNIGSTHYTNICKYCCKSLHIFLKWAAFALSDSTLQRCYDLCILRLNSHDPELQDEFASLLAFIPLDVVLRGSSLNNCKASYLQLSTKDVDLSSRPQLSILDLWTAFRGYMSRSSTGNFFSHHFRTLAAFILQGKEPQEKNWLQRLYISCPPPERRNRVDSLMNQLSTLSSSVLWFWGVWEVAQFCVVSKLRTPLGKPQETFMAIEGALKSAVKPTKNQEGFYSEPKHVTLLRNNLLLLLMEQLEKHMYNAYEGCATALPAPPKNVRSFFRTNKSTCHEWLSRVRANAVVVSLNAGCPAAAVRHGYEFLQELRNNGNTLNSEHENILYLIVKALIQLHCPEAVLGLYIWCKEIFNRKYTWMKASVDCAAGRFESAGHEYLCILQSLSHNTNSEKKDLNKVKNGTNEQEILVTQLNGSDVSVNKHQIDVPLHSFLINQVVDCYVKVQNWSEAIKWAEFLGNVKFHQNGLSVQKANTSNNLSYIRCLTSFDEATTAFTKKDATTLVNNLTNSEPQSNDFWTMEELFNKAQKIAMCVAINSEAKIRSTELSKDLSDQLNEAKAGIIKLMKITTMNWPLQLDANQASLFLSASSYQFNKASSTLLRENVKFDPSDCYSSVLGFLLNWENIWLRMNQSSPTGKLQGGFFDLLMITARLARKQQNFGMGYKLVFKALSHLCKNSPAYETRELSFPNSYDLSSMDYLKSMMTKTINWSPSEKLAKIQRESAKLFHCAGENESSFDLLLNSISVISNYIKNSNLSNVQADQLAELNSRSMLNLVKYIQHETKMNSSDNSELHASKDAAWHFLLKNTINDMKPLDLSNLCKHFESGLPQEKEVSESDYLVGELLQLSVYQCPSLAKSWCSFASWCYGHGRKVVNSACNGSLSILSEEKEKILALIPNAHKEDTDVLLGIITSLHNASGSEWDNQEMDYTESGAEEIRWQLMTYCPFLLKLENQETIIENIIEIWKGLVTRAYSYYRIAAVSYLQYLKLNGKCADKEKTEDDNLTATLRILRLIIKHASELRDVLEDGLAETPTAPWRGIIPQLFSRLNHPEVYVRQSISDLLCRVAQAAPHLIVFPAVVGSLTLKVGPQFREETSGLFGTYFSDTIEDAAESQVESSQVSAADELPQPIASLSDDDTEDDGQKTAIMQNCFAALVETLGSQDERTISEAKNLIHELHRITLLWDELWLGTLNTHQSEVNRRFLNLEKEIAKVMNNQFLSKDEKREIIKEKHNVCVKSTLYLLEQLQTITSQPAETPHEHWFQKTFEKPIENAVNKLKNPEDPSRPQESWAVFKQLYQLLQQKVQQQSRSHLTMEHISPVLASLKSTVIPMPGINKPSGVVTVQSVNNTVSILPTKTKPKKLAFMGSDGLRYTYLFKGLEDLHLDERIMQFLSIVNNMFAKNKRHGKQVYYARHYSVTPLGPRSGLIQWVDGATPLFGVYKRWQQREASASVTKGQNSNGNATILRPSEIFYNKLTPLLKEKNINSLDNRKEWPLSVLLDVLKQLMSETPDSLLAKELWCSCSSPQEWWNNTLTYNYSTAVMSIIGYIIGLGDRHLDNVLVDLTTGEIVHIDYNVCFEKGKNLRVPEKVPFRMTPNIKTALGLTGVEGIFRTSCEHSMKVLRKGKETLLTLLEAFVYDPLVDWTPGSEGGYTGAVYGGRQAWATEAKQTRQNMELDVSLSMFAIRVAEMRGEWLKNRDDLLSAFPKLENLLQEGKKAQSGLQIAETQLQKACQEKALLEEALANPNHNLYTVPKRYDETTIVKTTVNAAKEAVTEKLNECKKWHALHCEALCNITTAELNKRYGDVSSDQNYDVLSVAPVVEFLQSAGQGQLVQQCEQAESDLASSLQQRRLAMRSCIDLFTTYATVILQFGPTYKEQNRCFRWKQWLENLLSDFSTSKCLEIHADFSKHYTRESPDAIQSAISLDLQFKSTLNDANSNVIAIIERMRIQGLDDKNKLLTFVEESKCAVFCYLKESDELSRRAFLSMLAESLCIVRKQFFRLEMVIRDTVSRSTWNEDALLDEIFSFSSKLVHYTELILDSSMVENIDLKSALQGVKLAHYVFNGLEDLTLHFQHIILPEAIKTALEPSVIEMVAKLDRIIARCGTSLEKLIIDLQNNITNLLLTAQVTESRVADTVKKLRNEFESLMQKSDPQISGLNLGQMLLMGFNGLFTKVDSDLEALLTFLDNFAIPNGWQKLDFYVDSINFSPAIHHPSTRPILKDIYFVKKLCAMQQSFHACYNFASSLKINPMTGVLERESVLISDLQLIKPVKQFTAEYIHHMVLGLPSQAVGFAVCMLINHLGYDLSAEIVLRDVGVENKFPVDELLSKASKWCMSEHFLDSKLPVLTPLINAYHSAWLKEDIARRMEQHLMVARGIQQRAQLHLARFQWLNEDLLLQGNIGTLQSPSISSRGSVMSEIRKTVNTLVGLDSTVTMAHERYMNLTSGIQQRLKWAAGANPSLLTIQKEFEAAIDAKTSVIANANQMSRDLANLCNYILHFEAFRTKTPEAVAFDNTFLTLINRCMEASELAERCQSKISPIEEHLISLQLLDTEGVTIEWLTSVIKKVSQFLSSSREKLEHQKNAAKTCWDSLHLQVVNVHDLISVHHKLMSEVRHILRNLGKHEEQELGTEFKTDGHIHRYMARYKEFSEGITTIISKLLSQPQDMDPNSITAIESEIPVLSVNALEIYNQLLELAGPLGNRKHGLTEAESSKLMHKKNLLSPMYEPSIMHSPANRPKTPRGGTPKKSIVPRDPHTGKAVQERNTYATNVWKRIKMKLDGKDPDPSKKASISEQVDFVIKQATNQENLAVLYEGWTPWV
ncbi:hypothetical protein CDAR_374792 [Caerostris darwini]|uniref:non-specific serine/threonine protein kinase n=1 Tax=Caerostris darwini TaxID=1538125 RepID=A0AAV4RMV2_9ARAC|nr:hypothetical protein CDAR_374792 [Caerostris darwini]